MLKAAQNSKIVRNAGVYPGASAENQCFESGCIRMQLYIP